MNKQTILTRLTQYKHSHADTVLALGLFGSVARDEATDQSDVDIAVQTPTPDPFLIVRIKEDLQNLLARPVDIVRYRERMNPYLKEQIDREAVYV